MCIQSVRGTAEGGREDRTEWWMFSVKERVGGSLGGRQQGYSVKRERRENEVVFVEECDSVECMGDGTE